MFGAELWNRLDAIDALTVEGIGALGKLSSFLGELHDAERDYARSLDKIAKKYVADVDKMIAKEEKKAKKDGAVAEHPKVALSSYNQAWKAIGAQVAAMGKAHLTLSDNVHDDLVRLVKVQEKEMEKQRKKHLDDIRAAKADYKQSLDKFNSVEKSWKGAMRDKENAQNAYEKAARDTKLEQRDVDKLRADNEGKAAALETATSNYIQTTAETNAGQERHFTKTLHQILEDIQKNDEIGRTTFAKQTLSGLLDMYSKLLPTVEGAVNELYVAVKAINAEDDSRMFVEATRRDEAMPAVLVCQAEEIAAGGMSPIKLRPTVEEEIIASADAKRGRKKAADRLAALDKELKKHEMQRSLSLAAGKDVREFDRRISIVKIKMNQLENYVARCEGRSETPLPSELAAFEASLVVQEFDILETLCRATGTPAGSPRGPASQPASPQPALAAKRSSAASSGDVAGAAAVPPYQSRSASLRASNTGLAGAAVGVAGSGALAASASNNRLAASTGSIANKRGSAVPAAVGASAASVSRVSAGPASPGATGGNSVAELAPIGRCKALYNFDGQPGSTELTIKAGQQLEILEKQEEWWHVRVVGSSERSGFVPANYCEEG